MNRTAEQCESLDEYLDGRLAEAARDGIEEHIVGCGVCRERTASWQAIKREYADWLVDKNGTMEAPEPTEASVFVAAVVEKLEAKKIAPPTRRPVSTRLYRYAAVAAAAAIVLGIVQLFDWHSGVQPEGEGAPVKPPVVEKSVSEAGSISIAQIADGTVTSTVVDARPGFKMAAPPSGRILASLSTDRIGLGSSGALLILSADANETVLRLLRGVASFSVTHRDKGGRFRVLAGEVTVTVVGTRFSVSMDEDRAVTVVVEQGTVMVSVGNENATLEERQSITVQDGVFSSIETADEAAITELSRLLSDEISAHALEGDESIEPRTADTETFAERGVRGGRKQTPRVPRNDIAAWRNLIIQGEVSEAFGQISAYLEESPTDAEASMLLATCLKKLGRYQDAVAVYEQISTSSDVGRATRARYLAGEICQSKLGDYKGAVYFFDAYLENASAAAPNRAEAALRLAESLLKMGNKTRAVGILEQIISEYGRTPIANRARALLEQNR